MTDSSSRTTKQAYDGSEELENLLRLYDAAQCLPLSISSDFLSAALMHMIDNKIQFGMVRTNDKIYIAYHGGDDDHVPQRWADKKWHIGPDPDEMYQHHWDDVP